MPGLFSWLQIGAFAVLLIGLLWYRGNAIKAEAEVQQREAEIERIEGELQTAIDVNRINEQTIGRLRAQMEADARDSAELAEELRKLNEKMAENNEALGELKEKDENVRDYLNTPVPDDLRRMYDQ